jgi:hypothetical protein
MRNGLFALMALAVGGIGYAAVTSGSPPTRSNSGGSCCGMSMGDMASGMGCKMGCNTIPRPQPRLPPRSTPRVVADRHSVPNQAGRPHGRSAAPEGYSILGFYLNRSGFIELRRK